MGGRLLRVVGGPCDGAEIDAGEPFGGRPPGGLVMHLAGGRVARYDLDADGLLYRFRAGRDGRPAAAAEPLATQAERSARRADVLRTEAARLAAEARELRERSRRLREGSLARAESLLRAVAESRETRRRREESRVSGRLPAE